MKSNEYKSLIPLIKNREDYNIFISQIRLDSDILESDFEALKLLALSQLNKSINENAN